ncbi:MAG: adenosylcobinamide-phosphate synthase CbiB [Hyphomicrobiales bacterium]|nr:adenosylcobinamide-phosphate synthase CbiB [Hyphomicrobiales bacterium]
MFAATLLIALAIDAAVGDPDWLWRRYAHPVVWAGRLIARLDESLNQETASAGARRAAGVLAVTLLVAAAGLTGYSLSALFDFAPLGWLAEASAAAVLLAQRSLYEHVARVGEAFAGGGLPEARLAVSMIVGRDPNALDEAGVCRAAVETLAENFSDGVVAPAFWFLVGGLPGLCIYKAVNTADSMIGNRSPRHEAFGWAAARLDDALNLAPARLSGAFVALAALLTGKDARRAALAMRRDAWRHRSPNAGWPEAAMAGALGLALAGPRVYATGPVDDAYMNDGGRREATPQDIARALRLYVAACGVLWAVVALIAAIALS